MKRGDYNLILIGPKGMVGMKSAHHRTNEVKLWRSIFNDVKAIRPITGMQYGLTPQETRTAKLICGGLRNKEAAEKMGVSPNTVGTFVRNIYEKIGAKNRSQMVLKLGSITLT